MKHIELTQGHVALVDDEDYEALAAYSWWVDLKGKTFYARRSVSRFGGGAAHNVSMHRQIMHYLYPEAEIDHIDGDGLNNRRSNLRPATHWQNCANTRRNLGKSGYRGVVKIEYDKFRARIGRDHSHIGVFDTAKEAARAYDEAARQRYGEFARLNFPT